MSLRSYLSGSSSRSSSSAPAKPASHKTSTSISSARQTIEKFNQKSRPPSVNSSSSANSTAAPITSSHKIAASLSRKPPTAPPTAPPLTAVNDPSKESTQNAFVPKEITGSELPPFIISSVSNGSSPSSVISNGINGVVSNASVETAVDDSTVVPKPKPIVLPIPTQFIIQAPTPVEPPLQPQIPLVSRTASEVPMVPRQEETKSSMDAPRTTNGATIIDTTVHRSGSLRGEGSLSRRGSLNRTHQGRSSISYKSSTGPEALPAHVQPPPAMSAPCAPAPVIVQDIHPAVPQIMDVSKIHPAAFSSTNDHQSESSTTTCTDGPGHQWLVVVVPPMHLPHDPPAHGVHSLGYGPAARFSGGVLMKLERTMSQQLTMIARAFSLPSILGVYLYLSLPPSVPMYPMMPTDGTELGLKPRLSEELWPAVWSGLWDGEADGASPTKGSPMNGLNMSGMNTMNNMNMGGMGMIGGMPGVGFGWGAWRMPIVGRLEFDIDIRKARWYEQWLANANPHQSMNSQPLYRAGRSSSIYRSSVDMRTANIHGVGEQEFGHGLVPIGSGGVRKMYLSRQAAGSDFGDDTVSEVGRRNNPKKLSLLSGGKGGVLRRSDSTKSRREGHSRNPSLLEQTEPDSAQGATATGTVTGHTELREENSPIAKVWTGPVVAPSEFADDLDSWPPTPDSPDRLPSPDLAERLMGALSTPALLSLNGSFGRLHMDHFEDRRNKQPEIETPIETRRKYLAWERRPMHLVGVDREVEQHMRQLKDISEPTPIPKEKEEFREHQEQHLMKLSTMDELPELSVNLNYPDNLYRIYPSDDLSFNGYTKDIIIQLPGPPSERYPLNLYGIYELLQPCLYRVRGPVIYQPDVRFMRVINSDIRYPLNLYQLYEPVELRLYLVRGPLIHQPDIRYMTVVNSSIRYPLNLYQLYQPSELRMYLVRGPLISQPDVRYLKMLNSEIRYPLNLYQLYKPAAIRLYLVRGPLIEEPDVAYMKIQGSGVRYPYNLYSIYPSPVPNLFSARGPLIVHPPSAAPVKENAPYPRNLYSLYPATGYPHFILYPQELMIKLPLDMALTAALHRYPLNLYGIYEPAIPCLYRIRGPLIRQPDVRYLRVINCETRYPFNVYQLYPGDTPMLYYARGPLYPKVRPPPKRYPLNLYSVYEPETLRLYLIRGPLIEKPDFSWKEVHAADVRYPCNLYSIYPTQKPSLFSARGPFIQKPDLSFQEVQGAGIRYPLNLYQLYEPAALRLYLVRGPLIEEPDVAYMKIQGSGVRYPYNLYSMYPSPVPNLFSARGPLIVHPPSAAPVKENAPYPRNLYSLYPASGYPKFILYPKEYKINLPLDMAINAALQRYPYNLYGIYEVTKLCLYRFRGPTVYQPDIRYMKVANSEVRYPLNLYQLYPGSSLLFNARGPLFPEVGKRISTQASADLLPIDDDYLEVEPPSPTRLPSADLAGRLIGSIPPTALLDGYFPAPVPSKQFPDYEFTKNLNVDDKKYRWKLVEGDAEIKQLSLALHSMDTPDREKALEQQQHHTLTKIMVDDGEGGNREMVLSPEDLLGKISVPHPLSSNNPYSKILEHQIATPEPLKIDIDDSRNPFDDDAGPTSGVEEISFSPPTTPDMNYIDSPATVSDGVHSATDPRFQMGPTQTNGLLSANGSAQSPNPSVSPRSPSAESDASQYAVAYPPGEGVSASSTEMPSFGVYPDPVVFSFKESVDLTEALAEFVLEAQDQSIRLRGRFTLALSGGSLPKLMAPALLENPRVRWDKWIIFFADERLVPLDHPDSNYKAWMDKLLAFVPLEDWQIYAIKPYDALETAPSEVAEQITQDYESSLTEVFGPLTHAPVFDLVLLGMGEDGHTASLFPGHPLLKENEWFVVWIGDSPKPPSYRITFTLPMINSARRVAFAATGAGKQAALRDVLENVHSELPAAMVKLHNHPIVWFVDDAASRGTNYTISAFWDEEA